MGYWRAILSGCVAGALLFAVAAWSQTPRHDRDWVDHLAVTPAAVWSPGGEEVALAPVRDWQYLPLSDGVATLEVYQQQRAYALENLEAVWFIEEPHPGLPMMAHTFVVFDFGPRAQGGGGMVGLTIEARKVEGERYNPLLGALNKYELVHVWAEPRDLMTRRATLLGHELYAYRLDLSAEQRAAYFRSLTTRTQAIASQPRFYNTLWSNCTNELAKAAGLSWDPAFILTGGAAEALFERGLIGGDDFKAVKADAEIASAIAGTAFKTQDFNALLRDRGAR